METTKRMNQKSMIIRKWRRLKKLNEKEKNSEVTRKLNRFLITRDVKDQLSILDEVISLIEKDKERTEGNPLEDFKNILSSQSFLKQDGKAEVIGLQDTKEENKGKSIYERLGVPENDDMKNYQVFKLLTKTTEGQQTKKENKEGFHSIHEILEDAKYFEVPENINWMLCNTKNKVSKIKLPHIFMFFDTKFIIEDRTYYGLLLGDIAQLKEMVEKSKDTKHKDLALLGDDIIIQTFYDDADGVGWTKLKLYEKTRSRKLNKLKEYIMNLIYFINSEDVKIMVHTRSRKNAERRIQNKKIPIPSHSKIQVIGYLKKYIEKIESSGTNRGFTHRFTVRGHWRHFWNKRFDSLYKAYEGGRLEEVKGKSYTMDASGTLKVWVYPYIKGSGILIDKKYELT